MQFKADNYVIRHHGMGSWSWSWISISIKQLELPLKVLLVLHCGGFQYLSIKRNAWYICIQKDNVSASVRLNQ
jgi:hypothetical protein